MIVREDADRLLLDCKGMWAYSGRRAISTIRRYCEPIACDVTTKLLLYDAKDAADRLAAIPSRASRPRQRRAA